MQAKIKLSSLLLVGLTLISACADDPTIPDEFAASVAPTENITVEMVAQALAGALAQPNSRMRLLADLRDSPFPQHRIHLTSYLRGENGMALVADIANALQSSSARVLRDIDALPELEMYVPRKLDRLQWRGEGDILVAGFEGAPESTSYTPVVGYDIQGNRHLLRCGVGSQAIRSSSSFRCKRISDRIPKRPAATVRRMIGRQ